MENTATMPSMPMAHSVPSPMTPAKSKKEHLLVELAGGVTLASTIVSGLTMWYLMLAYVFPIS